MEPVKAIVEREEEDLRPRYLDSMQTRDYKDSLLGGFIPILPDLYDDGVVITDYRVGMDRPVIGELPGYVNFGFDDPRINKFAEKYGPELLDLVNEELGGEELRYEDIEIKAMKPMKVQTPCSERKILGLYDPSRKIIYLSSDLDEIDLIEVLTHEMFHHKQDKIGVIDSYLGRFGPKKAREYIEKDAYRGTYKILRKNYDTIDMLIN